METAPEPRFEFRNKARFWWKTITLAVTTLALIPILLFQDLLGAKFYLGFLLVIHVGGLLVFAYGVGKEDIAPSKKGFYGRLAGLTSIIVLLYFASKGLSSSLGSSVFWISLFGIWALHTGGLVLLHLRGNKETACPFL